MTTNMAPDGYYRSGSQRVPLAPDPELIAVRFSPKKQIAKSSMDTRATRLLRGAVPEAFLANHGVQILRAPGAGEDDRQAVLPLDRDERVDFAAPVMRVADDRDNVVVVHPNVLVQFRSELGREQIEGILKDYGARIIAARPFLDNTYLVRAEDGFGSAGPVALANRLIDDGHAIKASPDIVRRIETRSTSVLADTPSAATRAPQFDDEQ